MMQHLYGLAMQMLGLYGLLLPGSSWTPSRGSIAKNWLSAFSATIAAGTSEIQRNIIATPGPRPPPRLGAQPQRSRVERWTAV